MKGLEYKGLLKMIFDECENEKEYLDNYIDLTNEETKTKMAEGIDTRVSYIISPLDREVKINDKLFLDIEKDVQVRIDDIVRVLLARKIPENNKEIMRLLGKEKKEIYVCKTGKDYKPLLEIKPKEQLKVIEFVRDYRYGKENEEEKSMRILFFSEYRFYFRLLEAMRKMNLGIYEVEYYSGVSLQQIIDGEIPIGFVKIKKIWPYF